jgi:hypothetical protein
MKIMRRALMVGGVASLCGMLPVMARADGWQNRQGAGMGLTALIAALRAIATPVCTGAADRLAAQSAPQASFDLHLRKAGLDEAGRAILKWAGVAPALRMICVEQNGFSPAMRAQIKALGQDGRALFVVV